MFYVDFGSDEADAQIYRGADILVVPKKSNVKKHRITIGTRS